MSDEKNNKAVIRKPSTIENMLLGGTIEEVPRLIPGVLLAGALVALFVWLTSLLNAALGFKGLISYILVVIVAGIMIRNTRGVPTLLIPGINFCLKKLLRLGIMLMGIRLSIFAALEIGAWGIPIVVFCVLTGIVVAIYLGRLLKLPDRLATLIAVGTAICGASAIVATAPGIKAKDEEITYAVANITVFGIIAMITYPFIANQIFNGDTAMTGLFLGTSIHETAQVAASGLIYDQTFFAISHPTTADIAMVTKMVRNVLMAAVIPIMTFLYTRQNRKAGNDSEVRSKGVLRLFPLFILGFLFMAVLRSIGDAGIQGSGVSMGLWDSNQWAGITSGINEWAGYILATAMAGVGLGTSFKAMKGLGIKPFYLGLITAVSVGISAVIMIFLLGRFVGV
jgi:uncharacterized integral membrane protein (TIGR00698 family)